MMDPTSRAERLAAATEWLLRLNDESRTERDMAEWLAWCDADSANLEAFELIQRDWQELSLLKAAPAAQTHPPARRLRSGKRWALAASLAALALTGVMTLPRWPYPATVNQVVADNTNKATTLPDGSSVMLSAQTKLDVDFSNAGRELRLSAGEAYFKVRSDKQRPFTVHAGEVSITALGTAFNVRRDGERVTVTVAEGVVAISSQTALTPETSWRVEAGYQLTYSAALRNAQLSSVDPAVALKWREGELAYVAQTLGAVIADVNRYSHHRIVLEDQSVAELQFTGTVFIGAVEDWLIAVQDAYPVRVRALPNGDFALNSAAGPEARLSQFKNSSVTR